MLEVISKFKIGKALFTFSSSSPVTLFLWDTSILIFTWSDLDLGNMKLAIPFQCCFFPDICVRCCLWLFAR